MTAIIQCLRCGHISETNPVCTCDLTYFRGYTPKVVFQIEESEPVAKIGLEREGWDTPPEAA